MHVLKKLTRHLKLNAQIQQPYVISFSDRSWKFIWPTLFQWSLKTPAKDITALSQHASIFLFCYFMCWEQASSRCKRNRQVEKCNKDFSLHKSIWCTKQNDVQVTTKALHTDGTRITCLYLETITAYIVFLMVVCTLKNCICNWWQSTYSVDSLTKQKSQCFCTTAFAYGAQRFSNLKSMVCYWSQTNVSEWDFFQNNEKI